MERWRGTRRRADALTRRITASIDTAVFDIVMKLTGPGAPPRPDLRRRTVIYGHYGDWAAPSLECFT